MVGGPAFTNIIDKMHYSTIKVFLMRKYLEYVAAHEIDQEKLILCIWMMTTTSSVNFGHSVWLFCETISSQSGDFAYFNNISVIVYVDKRVETSCRYYIAALDFEIDDKTALLIPSRSTRTRLECGQ